MPSRTDGLDPGVVVEVRQAIEGGSVVAFTGAGVSAESGVPTFRGPGGLWRNHRPEDLATPGAFARDPELVWEWYRWRRSLVARCQPNAAHLALATRATDGSRLTVVTQNVDGLHTQATRAVAGDGRVERASPLELHGSLFRDRCTACTYQEERVPSAAVDADGAGGDPHSGPLPVCPSCGHMLRPDVVWFGEALSRSTLDAAFEAAATADVCLVIGTSGVVFPAAQIPMITHERGGTVIDVNPTTTALRSVARYHIVGTAAEVVPALLDAGWEHPVA